MGKESGKRIKVKTQKNERKKKIKRLLKKLTAASKPKEEKRIIDALSEAVAADKKAMGDLITEKQIKNLHEWNEYSFKRIKYLLTEIESEQSNIQSREKQLKKLMTKLDAGSDDKEEADNDTAEEDDDDEDQAVDRDEDVDDAPDVEDGEDEQEEFSDEDEEDINVD
eukprot:Colp12_sorted_trinity150504_noHs@3771